MGNCGMSAENQTPEELATNAFSCPTIAPAPIVYKVVVFKDLFTLCVVYVCVCESPGAGVTQFVLSI